MTFFSTPVSHALLVLAVLSAAGCKKKEEEVSIPGAPSLQTPVSGASSVSVFPTFTWNAVPGATSYEIQVSTSGSSFAVADLKDLATVYGTTFKRESLQYSYGVYLWRVRAINTAGAGAWSVIQTFTVDSNSPDQPGPVFGKLLFYEPDLPPGIEYEISVSNLGEKILSCAGTFPASCSIPDSCTFVRYDGIYSQSLNITVKYHTGPNAGQIYKTGYVSGYLGMCQRIRVSYL